MSLNSIEQRTTFLGTLASGNHGNDPLPDEFLALVARFDELFSLYEGNEITREQFAVQLRRLRVHDHDDFEWTIGATTRAWFRRAVDGGWITAPPPSAPVPRSSAPVDSARVAAPAGAGSPASAASTPAGYGAEKPAKAAPLVLEDLDDLDEPEEPGLAGATQDPEQPAYGY